ncbi:hypothetical protein F5883DRAFT_594913 [Diaporthe sp. PMI_573]|nr:hypothetical protein F5883DRAFT_594913 [Diaporthaceae sp. PMI_573]
MDGSPDAKEQQQKPSDEVSMDKNPNGVAAYDTRLLSRLAYVQLVRVIRLLENRVALDRQAGRLHRRSGYRNASIALDIYLKAQETLSTSSSRRTLIERKRLAKRWSELAGPWPLFLLDYSDEAEEIIQCHRRPDNTMIRLIAERTLRDSPSQLKEICAHAAQVVQTAVKEKGPVDDPTVRELAEKCRTELRECGQPL